jgi:hypothetical protein
MPRLHLLTLTRPGPFLEMLGHLGHSWDVVHRGLEARTEPWMLARELPAAMRQTRWAEARARVANGGYDAVVCHQLRDFVEIRSVAPMVPTVLHANPGVELAFGISAALAAGAIEPTRPDTACVFDSYQQRRSWAEAGLDGEVITPGVDVEAYGLNEGANTQMLTIGGLQAELPLLSGFDTLERLAAGLPLTVLGFNPALGLNRPLLPRRERLDALRTHRLYLNTSVGPLGDGANLFVLEAMASGTPVVTMIDPASPVTHGVHGFVHSDPASLRPHILELLEDGELALKLGRAAREMVRRDYPVSRFISRWDALLTRLTDASSSRNTELRQISA